MRDLCSGRLCIDRGDTDDNYSTISGGDRVQKVRPDIFLTVSKSGFYIPEEEAAWMVADKLVSKLSGPAIAATREPCPYSSPL